MLTVNRLFACAAAFLTLAAAFAAQGCGDDDSGSSIVSLECPGGKACEAGGDGVFYAGAAVVDLTPLDLLEGPSFVDSNGDGEYNDRDGDTFTDTNGNEDLDAVWIAGYGSSRPAVDVHDPLEGRIVALRQNNTTIVWIAADLVGFFYDYIQEVQARLDPTTAAEVDLLMVSATHTHQGPDTVGIWGTSLTESGLDLDYLDFIFDQLADGVADAVADLREAHATFGAIAVEDPDGSTRAYVGDGRDPVIIDTTLNVMRLFEPTSGETIATVVIFASHAEFMDSDNNLLSADYPYFLREAVESGDTTGLAGIGGVCLFVNGSVGGQIGPHDVVPRDRAGNEVHGDNYARAQAVGESYAEFALKALATESGAVTVEQPDLFFRTRHVYATIENQLYQAAWRLGIFNRELHNFNPEAFIDDTNTPQVRTELVYLRVGPASMVSIPGELHPEVFIGCYDGSCTGNVPIIDPNNSLPPDLSKAPGPPYLRDLLEADGSRFQWSLGLTQDELGYIMPDYNYVLDENAPYLEEAPGDHYEETNSLGPRVFSEIIVPLEELITLP